MMYFTTIATLALFATSALATVPVTYDNTYDNKAGSLSTVSCSNGENGLLNKGFKTFGDLPNWPNVGGAPAVEGWNSVNCGTCWALNFHGKTINVLAIDAGSEFNIAQQALDNLTNGQAVDLGQVQANATQVAASVCGL